MRCKRIGMFREVIRTGWLLLGRDVQRQANGGAFRQEPELALYHFKKHRPLRRKQPKPLAGDGDAMIFPGFERGGHCRSGEKRHGGPGVSQFQPRYRLGRCDGLAFHAARMSSGWAAVCRESAKIVPELVTFG